jgi:lambda family phage minor tail protein L
MALPLSAAAYLEKNSLESDGAFLLLLEVDLPDSSVLRLARNPSDIEWNGNTYQRFPFELDEIGDSSKNEVPSVGIRIGNVTRAIQAFLEQYNGLTGAEVRILVVHSAHLDVATPEVSLTYQVVGCSADNQWVSLSLGASSPFMRRFPQARLLLNHCRWKFKSTECGYAGAETTCSKSLGRCQQLANSPRFGGFPGVGRGGAYA